MPVKPNSLLYATSSVDIPSVHVYYSFIRERWTDTQYRAYQKILPPTIVNNIPAFYRWQDSHAALVGKLLLKQALSDVACMCTLEDIRYTEYNRPYIASYEVDFNISHAGQCVVCAISRDGKVGVDIEHVRPVDVEDFASVFSENEYRIVQKDSQMRYEQFYTLWTRKEAVIKANGKGLSLPLQGIDVTQDRILVENTVWYLRRLLFLDNYISHLATDFPVKNLFLEEVRFV